MEEAPIFGRDRELASLRAGLVAAAGGAGRLVLVGGEAGIGKTRLATAVAAMAGSYGIPVARGHAVDDPGMPPLWPWRRLARSLPALHRVLSDVHSGTDDSARFALFADAADALVAEAEPGGLLIVLEDLHWADRTSLRLLAHLATELPDSRILVVATHREAELSELMRAPATRAVQLRGLSHGDVTGWVRSATAAADPESVAARLVDGTGGNPLYVRMLLDSGEVAGHLELHRLVLSRLDRLSPRARDVLGVASVLGERIDPALLAAVTGEDPAVPLDDAVATRVLQADEGSLAFTHALVRDAVYEDLAPSVRAELHRRCAVVLAASGGAPGRIATQWRRASGADAAAECTRWATEAARAATAELAYDEAAGFAALALATAEEKTAELTLGLARAEFLAGDTQASLAHCRTAARLAQEAGAPGLIAEAALVITGLGDRSLLAAVDQLCTTALRHLPEEATATRARLLARRAMAATMTGAAQRARELSAAALELAVRSGDPDAELDGIHARHLTLCAPQFRDERVELANRAVALAETARQPHAELWGHVWLVDAAIQVGDLAEVDRQLDLIEQFAAARQHGVAWWHLHRLRATRAALVGQLQKARECNETARAVAERMGVSAAKGMYHAFRNEMAQLVGGIDEATAREAFDMIELVGDIPLARVYVPFLHALLGQTEQARATFEEFRAMPATLEAGPTWAPLVWQIGVVACMLDDAETAASVYSVLSTLDPCFAADGSGAVFSTAATPRLLGDLAMTCGWTEVAAGHYRLALEMNARIGARPFAALSRLGLARALTDLPAARTLAAEAAAEFRALDMPIRLAEADRLLTRIGAAEQAQNPLSPRESEVVDLVAQALTNRQIATRLHLSERTVETHVRSVLAKLGLRTRTEIAAWELTRRA
ncbi:regulatory protein, luxR family [Lentzea albidocapillata subsp. violacea]|uniref:Regulatory protein, luxR family n=1 Tax=Lentzea albidocapillata subsp. violacea TaxID=128104 RepID=A0A1G8QU00_9PSEU|nr:LuxR family transcriptional regulator [Lentzea albidocapillata]SDJ07640.1 regulatory protein, luxR family [Lentzea albidocapillata subsp. violacea]